MTLVNYIHRTRGEVSPRNGSRRRTGSPDRQATSGDAPIEGFRVVRCRQHGNNAIAGVLPKVREFTFFGVRIFSLSVAPVRKLLYCEVAQSGLAMLSV